LGRHGLTGDVIIADVLAADAHATARIACQTDNTVATKPAWPPPLARGLLLSALSRWPLGLAHLAATLPT